MAAVAVLATTAAAELVIAAGLVVRFARVFASWLVCPRLVCAVVDVLVLGYWASGAQVLDCVVGLLGTLEADP